VDQRFLFIFFRGYFRTWSFRQRFIVCSKWIFRAI